MDLTNDIVQQFQKAISNSEKSPEGNLYGTIRTSNGALYVKLDDASGGEVLTPAAFTVDAKDGDRVILSVRDHQVVVSGNLTDMAVGATSVTTIANEAGSVLLNDALATTIPGMIDESSTETRNLMDVRVSELIDGRGFTTYKEVSTEINAAKEDLVKITNDMLNVLDPLNEQMKKFERHVIINETATGDEPSISIVGNDGNPISFDFYPTGAKIKSVITGKENDNAEIAYLSRWFKDKFLARELISLVKLRVGKYGFVPRHDNEELMFVRLPLDDVEGQ